MRLNGHERAAAWKIPIDQGIRRTRTELMLATRGTRLSRMAAILTYHHIDAPPAGGPDRGLYVAPEAFEAQLRQLDDMGVEVISLERLRQGLLGELDLPARAAVLTFDDGYEDNYRHAFPLLQSRGATATFFIVTRRIGGSDESGRRYLSEDQLREMQAAGMEIGSHTVSHPWLARISPDEAREELSRSERELASILDAPVRWICYPNGSFNAEVARIAEEVGYVGACSVIRDNRATARQLFYLPRVMVMPDTTPRRFRYYFGGLYHLVHARKNRKRWAPYL